MIQKAVRNCLPKNSLGCLAKEANNAYNLWLGFPYSENPLGFSILFLFANFRAGTRHKSYARPFVPII